MRKFKNHQGDIFTVVQSCGLYTVIQYDGKSSAQTVSSLYFESCHEVEIKDPEPVYTLTNKELNEIIERRSKAMSNERDDALKEMERVRGENKLLLEGLEFYGDEGNWTLLDRVHGDLHDTFQGEGDNEVVNGKDCGGRKARQILGQIMNLTSDKDVHRCEIKDNMGQVRGHI